MSAMWELREGLRKRGESWHKWPDKDSTTWQAYSNPHTATESMDGALIVTGLTPEQAIESTLGKEVTGETSDGYHTFDELYHHRAVLFSVIVRDHPALAWKSKLHHDGTMYDNMFIVGIETPTGQATYHYDIDPYWEMFDCKELEQAPEWDGHTPADAIDRIAMLGLGECHDKNGFDPELGFECTVCGAMVDTYMVTPMEMGHVRQFAYCPFCGRHVVEVDG